MLLFDFFIAFYCFSMAIRFYNHVGYMINLGNDSVLSTDLTSLTCRYLNRAGAFFSFGTRSFFFSLPISQQNAAIARSKPREGRGE